LKVWRWAFVHWHGQTPSDSVTSKLGFQDKHNIEVLENVAASHAYGVTPRSTPLPTSGSGVFTTVGYRHLKQQQRGRCAAPGTSVAAQARLMRPRLSDAARWRTCEASCALRWTVVPVATKATVPT